MFYCFRFPRATLERYWKILSQNINVAKTVERYIEHLYVGNLLWDKICRSGLAAPGVMIDTPADLRQTPYWVEVCAWLTQTRIPTWPFHYKFLIDPLIIDCYRYSSDILIYNDIYFYEIKPLRNNSTVGMHTTNCYNSLRTKSVSVWENIRLLILNWMLV